MGTISTTESSHLRPPPTARYTVLGWLHKNLFSNWYNTLLTLLALGVIYAVLRPSLTWVLTQANWEVVTANLRLLMVGQYPLGQVWRIWLCLYLLAALLGANWGVWVDSREATGFVLVAAPLLLAALPFSLAVRINLILLDVVGLAAWFLAASHARRVRRYLVTAWLLYFPLVILIVRGVTPQGGFVPVVTTNLWGGLLLTFLLAIVGIVCSFPIGILLALGRQSKLPIVRGFCIIYIEVIRGVPLVTLLFMSQIMLPLFLPSNLTIDRVLRAMVGLIMFSSAYMAENVRGGLQSVPHGQYEAADALGLNGLQSMVYIILPQALRAVIPVIVGQFISLFKDTTLVAIVGLLDLLGIANTIIAQPRFIGLQREVYLFVALAFWIFCYSMAYASQRLEAALDVGRA